MLRPLETWSWSPSVARLPSGAGGTVAGEDRDRHEQLLPRRPDAGGVQIREPDEHIAELDDESTTTSEMLQAHLPESFVVKGFNNIIYPHLADLARPVGDPDRSALVIAGNDERAKQVVAEFLSAVGYDTLDAGPLSEAGVSSGTPLPTSRRTSTPSRVIPGPGRPPRRTRSSID